MNGEDRCVCGSFMNVCAYVTAYTKGGKSSLWRQRESATVKEIQKKKKDIGAGKSDFFCCHEERDLITARPSVCSLGRGGRNRVTG